MTAPGWRRVLADLNSEKLGCMGLLGGERELIELVTTFRRDTLAGDKSDCMCFSVCAPLSVLLCLWGIRAEFRSGIAPVDPPYHHYWIELPDGRVLDPTADQFNGQCGLNFPEVYLGEPTIIHARGRT